MLDYPWNYLEECVKNKLKVCKFCKKRCARIDFSDTKFWFRIASNCIEQFENRNETTDELFGAGHITRSAWHVSLFDCIKDYNKIMKV